MVQMHPTVILERRVPGLSERKLAEFVAAACRSLQMHGTATVLITSSRTMRLLNTRFRGKNHATDVLSFPASPLVERFAGDIAVSFDIAKRNAGALGHRVSDEVRILVLHGLLHLAGYDHEADNGHMAKREKALRRKFALPSGLIERVGPVRRPATGVRRLGR